MDLEIVKLFFDRFGYLFLLAGAFIDGFHIMLLGGFLAGAGYIELVPALTVLFLGNFLSDLFWFTAAYSGGKRTINWLAGYYHALPQYIDKMKSLLDRYAGRIIVSVKLTLGLSLATVLAAGISKMKVQKFIAYDFLASMGTVLEVTLIGYLFGESYELLREYFKLLSILIPLLLISVLVLISYFNRKIRNK